MVYEASGGEEEEWGSQFLRNELLSSAVWGWAAGDVPPSSKVVRPFILRLEERAALLHTGLGGCH